MVTSTSLKNKKIKILRKLMRKKNRNSDYFTEGKFKSILLFTWECMNLDTKTL